jgi:GTP-binding protein Era
MPENNQTPSSPDNTDSGSGTAGENRLKSGYVAVIGRPNVGKSTLMNQILGQKVSIVTAKPQTTRHQIYGIHTEAPGQIVFIDTPGLHQAQGKALNRYMNRAAKAAVSDVDLVLLVVDALRWTDDDEHALAALKGVKVPVYLVVNKVDKVPQKEKLLPFLKELSEKYPFEKVFLLSASKGKGVEELVEGVFAGLPEGELIFSEDEITNKSVRYLVTEIIREKLMKRYHQEVPYSVAVEIESWREEPGIVHIHAIIWVERESQKAMLVGTGGEALKQIGIQARQDIEKLLGKKVNLKLWVKVKKAWADNDGLIQKMGYKDEF